MEHQQCENEETHGGHEHVVTMNVGCTGKTVCGAWSHRSHTYDIPIKVWCPGICNCGIISRPHNPWLH